MEKYYLKMGSEVDPSTWNKISSTPEEEIMKVLNTELNFNWSYSADIIDTIVNQDGTQLERILLTLYLPGTIRTGFGTGATYNTALNNAIHSACVTLGVNSPTSMETLIDQPTIAIADTNLEKPICDEESFIPSPIVSIDCTEEKVTEKTTEEIIKEPVEEAKEVTEEENTQDTKDKTIDTSNVSDLRIKKRMERFNISEEHAILLGAIYDMFNIKSNYELELYLKSAGLSVDTLGNNVELFHEYAKRNCRAYNSTKKGIVQEEQINGRENHASN